ncbi:DUF4418 family protein [Gilliamella sp. Pra-s65]|uniref:DUF4418 family protein n=1 Tax=unclassified Gilliamella TaxID=2685620 RepID=UPI001328D477|nr:MULTISPECIES: DUF4418 family protein [unclassified Gilliamella]MWN31405.1 DUF4418 family protein [Gilliamella sp. Pra-s60]MWN89646.1 DUF4418 family protein [Gilliamella sp. Pra-s65]MWP28987.1 DUF4418 family protein [Gilliamella sp. Pra-s54]MWP46231.1 DUF4418 family protein [Gilliamella sp. Pas-s27]MWP72654.1 DUF4418 family protein [Gilliamella sp. Pra-s52]
MKNRIISSSIFIIIGVLIILFPLYILPVCPLPEAIVTPVDTMSHGMSAMNGASSELAHSGHMHASTGKIMKCFWTARAEIGIGCLVIVIGALLLISRTAFIRMGLSMATACISLLAAAIPTILIGVCSNEMMRCNMGAKPALVLLSGLLFIAAVVNTYYLNKKTKNR